MNWRNTAMLGLIDVSFSVLKIELLELFSRMDLIVSLVFITLALKVESSGILNLLIGK